MSRYRFLFLLILFSGCAARPAYLSVSERERVLKTYDDFGIRVFANGNRGASIDYVVARVENRTPFVWEVETRCALYRLDVLDGPVFVTALKMPTHIRPWEVKDIEFWSQILRNVLLRGRSAGLKIEKYIWYCGIGAAEMVD